jgi:hypothetical protein
VKPFAALVAPRFAHRPGDFEGSDHRIERPPQRRQIERVGVERRSDRRRSWQPQFRLRAGDNETHYRVTRIGDDQAPRRRQGDSCRSAKARNRAVALGEARARAGNRAAAATRDFDDAPPFFGGVNRSVAGDSQTDRPGQRLHTGRINRVDATVGGDPPQRVIAGIGNVYVARGVDGDARWRIELGIAGGAIGAAAAPRPRDRRHGAVRLDRSNPIVVCVRDEDPARLVDCHTDRPVEARV